MLNFVGQLIQNWYMTLGYAGIVLAMAMESCLLPLPSEVIMPLAGAFTLAQFGARFNLVGVAFAGAIGCVLGSLVAYAIGAWGGRPFIYRYGKYLLISRHDFDLADRWFLRHGGAIAFFSRLLPVVRTYISLPAGIARMRIVTFVIYTFVGSLIWSGILAYVGQQLGARYDSLSTLFHGVDAVIIVLVVVSLALYIYRHVRQSRSGSADSANRTDPTDSTRAPQHTTR